MYNETFETCIILIFYVHKLNYVFINLSIYLFVYLFAFLSLKKEEDPSVSFVIHEKLTMMSCDMEFVISC